MLITDDGQVKVTDFGIARAVNTEESLTQTGAVMGTATYFSPEQAQGLGVDARSDIYSLGVVLYEMVTGRPPFLGESPGGRRLQARAGQPAGTPGAQPADPADLRGHHPEVDGQGPGPPLRHRRGAAGRPAALQRGPERAGHGRHHRHDRRGRRHPAVAAVGGMDATRSVDRSAGPGPTADPGPTARRPTSPAPTGPATTPSSLVILLLLLAVAGYFLGRNLGYFGGDASFNLPNVVGQQAQVATATLRADGLNVDPGPAGVECNPGHGHLHRTRRQRTGEEG